MAIILLAFACQRDKANPAPVAAAQADARPVATMAASATDGRLAAAEVPDAAADGSDASRASVDVAPAGAERHGPGKWVDSKLFRLQVGRVRSCGSIEGTPGVLVGVAVKIVAKGNEFAISPHDLTLENRGVIVQSDLPGRSRPEACSPRLAVKRLNAGQTAQGLVVFNVPPGFRPETGDITLAYRPTRWGGADRIEVMIPSCMETCPSPAPPRTAAPGRKKL